MVVFSASPALGLVLTRRGIQSADTLETALAIIGLIQTALWVTQRCCSTPDLSYWDGLLVAAASVTTGRNLASLLRSLFLLFAVAIVSLVFAVDHDQRRADRHAGLRFANLIICLHKQRLRRDIGPPE
jgi:hypothetical protein